MTKDYFLFAGEKSCALRYLLVISFLIILVASSAAPSSHADGIYASMVGKDAYNPYALLNDTGSRGSGGTAGTIDKTTTADGASRQYQIYVPAGAVSSPEPVPLVVFLHGAGGSKSDGKSIWQSYADAGPFIVASPQGEDIGGGTKSWRELYHFPTSDLLRDSKLVLKIINETTAGYNIDLSHIWVSGFSDGGTMDFRLAVNFSTIFSTACIHSGAWWPPDWAQPEWAARKIPFYERVGEDDGLKYDDYARDAKTAFDAKGYEFQLDVIPSFGHSWHSQSCQKFIDFEATRPLPHNYIRPSLQFSKPAPSEAWIAGTTNMVEWYLGCGNPSYQVTLELSTSGPVGPFSTINTVTQSDYGIDSYSWSIPSGTTATKNAVLRATIQDGSSPAKTNVSVMNYTFEITGAATPEMPVLLPIACITIAAVALFVQLNRQRD